MILDFDFNDTNDSKLLKNIKSILESYTDIDLDKAYEVFKSSYEKTTGSSWSKEKFFERAQNWQFYGDENGFVAVRPQKGGLKKLVGVAGNPKSILKGLNQLTSENVPLWGAVSDDIANMAVKKGFIRPPSSIISNVIKYIPQFKDYTVNPDGSIDIPYDDIGTIKKYFIVNKEYLLFLLQSDHIQLPIIIKMAIKTIIKSLL